MNLPLPEHCTPPCMGWTEGIDVTRLCRSVPPCCARPRRALAPAALRSQSKQSTSPPSGQATSHLHGCHLAVICVLTAVALSGRGVFAVRGMLLGATAAAVVIGLAVLLVGTPQDGASTTAPLAYGAADPDAGAAVNPPPPVNSPPPVAKRSVPPPSQMPTIATTNNGKSIGTWRDPSASASLTDLSTKVGEWQQMLKKVNYNSKQAGKLENKIVLLLEKLDETFDVAPQSEWQEELNTQLGVTYFAFARSRLRLEFFRDTHDHRKAYDTPLPTTATIHTTTITTYTCTL